MEFHIRSGVIWYFEYVTIPPDTSQCLLLYDTVVEPLVRFHDRVRKERRADELESESTAREYRNNRKQSESGSERWRTCGTSGDERRKESPKGGDS